MKTWIVRYSLRTWGPHSVRDVVADTADQAQAIVINPLVAKYDSPDFDYIRTYPQDVFDAGQAQVAKTQGDFDDD